MAPELACAVDRFEKWELGPILEPRGGLKWIRLEILVSEILFHNFSVDLMNILAFRLFKNSLY